MINRNAYYNAMRCGALLSANRSDAQHRATLLIATQRFVCFITPLLGVPLRPSTLLYATQRFVYFILAPLLSAAQCFSSQLNDLFVISATQLCESHLNAVLRPAPPLNSTLLVAVMCIAARRNNTQLHSTICLSSTRRIDTRLSAPQLYSTLCLSSPPRHSARQCATPLSSSPLNDLFVIYASRRKEPQRYSTPRNASQLNNLFVTTQCLSSRLPAAHRASTRLNSAQRFVCYLRDSSICISSNCATPPLYSTICLFSTPRLSALLDNARRNAAPLNSTICLLSARLCATPLASTQLNVINQ